LGRQEKGNTMKSDNSSAISELGEEIVRFVNSNTYKHLSATEKLIAICQAFGSGRAATRAYSSPR
jgi:hypothetical protein